MACHKQIALTVVAARKLADLLSKAHWHVARNHPDMANKYYLQVMEIFDTLKPGPVRSANLALWTALDQGFEMTITGNILRLPTVQEAEKLRDLAEAALREIEEALYVPRGKTEKQAEYMELAVQSAHLYQAELAMDHDRL